MKKRIICLSLCVVMFVTSLLPRLSALDLSLLVEQAQKDSQESGPSGLSPEDPGSYGDPDRIRTSEEGIQLIKEFEGFSSELISDVGNWAIGYGTHCDPEDYPDGITEEEADALMRETLAPIEEYITNYIRRNGITLTQEQFDAVASMTYNLGTSHVSSEYRLWAMLGSGIDNYSENDIASSIGVFCHIGTQINAALISRRTREAQLFLYGDYTGRDCPSLYYVIFDGNGGEVETDIRFYVAGSKYQEFPDASSEDSHFAGWFTSDGVQLTSDGTASQNLTVTARWDDELPDNDIPLAPAPAPTESLFSDVASTDWFSSYVHGLFERGIIGGYSDSTFRPNAQVSVGESLKMILLAIGFPEQPKSGQHWASGYQKIALEYHFLDGSDFAPGLDAPASRILIAKLTANALALRRNAGISPFADTDSDYAVALYQNNIVEGSIDSGSGARMFYPYNAISRAEIAKIVWTLCETVQKP